MVYHAGVKAASLGTRKEYARRINAALDFIDHNLAEDIRLARLASAAHFSPFHFHRIFSSFIGEPPAEYIRRLRLEKAAGLLVLNPASTVTSIALACGFSTSALFCRLFKRRFGISPTAWRNGGFENRKNRQTNRKTGKDSALRLGYKLSEMSVSRERRSRMKKSPVVKVMDLPLLRVAYVKHLKGYEDGEGIGRAFEKVFSWAGPRGFISPDMKVLGISLDNPDITPKDKCRYWACVAVTERAQPEGDVGILTIRPGKYAVGRFSGTGDIFRQAYAYMYGEWLPRSGWQPDDAPAFESHIGEPEGPPGKIKFLFDLCVPVKLL